MNEIQLCTNMIVEFKEFTYQETAYANFSYTIPKIIPKAIKVWWKNDFIGLIEILGDSNYISLKKHFIDFHKSMVYLKEQFIISHIDMYINKGLKDIERQSLDLLELLNVVGKYSQLTDSKKLFDKLEKGYIDIFNSNYNFDTILREIKKQ